MILLTGGAGFIGSAILWELERLGKTNVVVADRLGSADKWKNIAKRQCADLLHKDQLFEWLEGNKQKLELVIHMGASSSTTVRDMDFLLQNNIQYTMRLWEICAKQRIPFIYASSAATYGDGSQGFSDRQKGDWRPLNPYGFSKSYFDQWALRQKEQPPFWAGLKFFNVYGPNEYHKGAQTSVVYQILPQIQATGTVKLFKSYMPGVAHGEQKRDFIYVKDAAKFALHLAQNSNRAPSGLYNVGTGKARTFLDLARAVFAALGLPERTEWIEMPDNIKSQYQYFTQATSDKIREEGGYRAEFTSLEAGVAEYVKQYLTAEDRYL